MTPHTYNLIYYYYSIRSSYIYNLLTISHLPNTSFLKLLLHIPPKGKPGVQGGKHKTDSERKRWERANETNEQTRLRLDKQRELQSARRDGESEDVHTARLLLNREYKPVYLESQTDEDFSAPR